MYTKKAFTLIEVMVVVCLCLLIASFAFVNVSFLDGSIIRIEIDTLVTACLYMQQLAIATNEEKYLIFDDQKHEYYFDVYREKLSQRLRFGFLPGIMGPPGGPTKNVEKAITFPAKRICFYPTGIISSGTVYFIDRKRKQQYALSNAISQVSYLRMYYYDGHWKLYKNDK